MRFQLNIDPENINMQGEVNEVNESTVWLMVFFRSNGKNPTNTSFFVGFFDFAVENNTPPEHFNGNKFFGKWALNKKNRS